MYEVEVKHSHNKSTNIYVKEINCFYSLLCNFLFVLSYNIIDKQILKFQGSVDLVTVILDTLQEVYFLFSFLALTTQLNGYQI